MTKILMPIPSTDFDPTETGVPWKILTQNKIQVAFATPNGLAGTADPIMSTGKRLGIWKPILQADKNGRQAFTEMNQSQEFQNPKRWDAIDISEFDGIILAGGHAPGMKEYLESTTIQKLIVDFFERKKLVAAICHGTVVTARSHLPSGKSVLFGKKTTALLRTQELTAWAMTYPWLKDYYRTYPETVQSEVERSLAQAADFISGPTPIRRDSPDDLNPGFCVQDDNYISARWPGDAHQFGVCIVEYFKNLKSN